MISQRDLRREDDLREYIQIYARFRLCIPMYIYICVHAHAHMYMHVART